MPIKWQSERVTIKVLNPIFDVEFSEFSYGFRKARSAHQAIQQSQRYINEGYQNIIDLDLKSKRSARRVKSSITKFIETKLHLIVNEQKTNICRPINYFTLGYGFVPVYKKGEKGKYNLRVSP